MAGGGWADVAEAGLGLADTVVSGVSGYNSQIRAQRFQAHQSDTAHQREVKDLQAAGLNPLLSVEGGQGASSPMPSAFAAHSDLQSIGPNISNIHKNSQEIRESKQRQQETFVRTKAENMQQGVLNSVIDYNNANSAKSHTESLVNLSQIDKIQAEIKAIVMQTRLNSAEKAKILEEIFRKQQENVPYRGPGGQGLPYVDYLLDKLQQLMPSVLMPLKLGPKTKSVKPTTYTGDKNWRDY